MATEGGPKIVRGNNLDVVLDASSQRAVFDTNDTNLIDYFTWNLNGSSATGFSRNGDVAENLIVTGTGPFGEQAVVWETRASGNNQADGGWNGSYVSCDPTKLYRVSVWVKRTSSTAGGTFYLGTNGGGACVLRLDNSASQCNPYWDCTGTSVFTQNVWYLVVGHIFPHTYSSTTGHPDSGRYTIASGKVSSHNNCNVGQDMKFASGTTSIRHRTYHYYCADNTTRLQFAYPRIDLVDETEPSIQDLLNGGRRGVVNLANRSQKFILPNKVRKIAATTIGKTNIKKFPFDATDDFIQITGGNHTSLQRSIEIVFRVNSAPFTYTPIVTYTRASGGTENTQRIWLGIQGGKFQMHGWGTTDPASTTTVTGGNYFYCVYAYNQSDKRHYIWVNGVLEHTSVNSQGGMTGWSNSSALSWWVGRDPQAAGWTSGAGQYFNGDISIFKTYSKILSTPEVQRNYQAYKNRFNI